jgi:hypothetical protein
MEAWIPLIQALIWPVFIAILLIVFRRQINQFVDIVINRVKKGGKVKVGPFEIGEEIPQDSYYPPDAQKPTEKDQEISKNEKYLETDHASEMPLEIRAIRALRLEHQIGPWGEDADGYTRRDVVVTLSTNPESLIDEIAKVTYYLPKSWPKKLRVQTRDKKSDNFYFRTRAYGEVTIATKVEFIDGRPPLVINRYCNFYAR